MAAGNVRVGWHGQRFNSAARLVDDSDSGNLFPRRVMTFFNPLSGSLLPATPAQRAADKGRQIARSQALRKNTAAEGDRVDVEHQVESAEELPPADEQSGGGLVDVYQAILTVAPSAASEKTATPAVNRQ